MSRNRDDGRQRMLRTDCELAPGAGMIFETTESASTRGRRVIRPDAGQWARQDELLVGIDERSAKAAS